MMYKLLIQLSKFSYQTQVCDWLSKWEKENEQQNNFCVMHLVSKTQFPA